MNLPVSRTGLFVLYGASYMNSYAQEMFFSIYQTTADCMSGTGGRRQLEAVELPAQPDYSHTAPQLIAQANLPGSL